MQNEKEMNKTLIETGKTALGIEFGSTRIKAVLIGEGLEKVASGSHTWENKQENGFWTYSLDDIWDGVRACFADLAADVENQYGTALERVGSFGVSAMMHGYMAFDDAGNLLAPFRTWRNTTTGEAAEKLTDLFGFSVPQRWSIAHLYQAILNGEAHVGDIRYITTLAGYIHFMLTGEKVLGIGDASGMFPIDDTTRGYDAAMIEKFDALNADKGFAWQLSDILPAILPAGQSAGNLTEAGAKLLDPTGTFKGGVPMCPPEGDAGTGMVATNSVRQRTGNISAGTSVFAMVVLEKALSKVYPEIDMVTTPWGDPVAMVHCNNFLSDIDAWVKLLGDAASALGASFDADKLYGTLYNLAMQGDPDCGGMMTSNYISGEHVTDFTDGCPMILRLPGSTFNLPNFMRANLYSACASLKIGMDILFGEQVKLDLITGHGGFFKVPEVGQKVMASAINAPVSVLATASDGGPWGMAVLALYMQNGQGLDLPDFLSDLVFADAEGVTVVPEKAEVEGFGQFMEQYKASLAVERAAVDTFF